MLMKKIPFVSLVCGLSILFSLLAPSKASAQRTSWGQSFVSVSFIKAAVPEASNKVFGGEFMYGEYNDINYWQGGAQYTPHMKSHPVGCFTVAGGVMYRLSASRDRAFNLYAGGNIFAGVDYVKEYPVVYGEGTIIPVDDEEEEKAGSAFVYGVEPRMEMEVFFTTKVAAILGVAVPLKVKSQEDKVSGRAYLGLRINF